MKFNLRRISNYACCEVEIDNAVHDLGMLDREQATQLMNKFMDAVVDLEWFLAVTDISKEQS